MHAVSAPPCRNRSNRRPIASSSADAYRGGSTAARYCRDYHAPMRLDRRAAFVAALVTAAAVGAGVAAAVVARPAGGSATATAATPGTTVVVHVDRSC